jgi:hypothetical protein
MTPAVSSRSRLRRRRQLVTIDYTKYTTDGDMRRGDLLYAVAEVKNEIGSKSLPRCRKAWYIDRSLWQVPSIAELAAYYHTDYDVYRTAH